jgi:stage II sporulation protein AA (anti-sigma F factor antagonist)
MADIFRVEQPNGSPELRLIGELDLTTTPILADALSSLPSSPEQPLLFDLSELTFLDSTGLNLLIRTAQSHAGGVQLRSPTPNVRRVLELAGLGQLFDIVD